MLKPAVVFESELQQLPISMSKLCHQMSASSGVKWVFWYRSNPCRGFCLGLICGRSESYFCAHLPLIEIYKGLTERNNPLKIHTLGQNIHIKTYQLLLRHHPLLHMFPTIVAALETIAEATTSDGILEPNV